MTYSVTPWPDTSHPSREAIQSVFREADLSPTTWSNGPGDRYSAHTHSYHKVLFCVEGSIVFHLDNDDVGLKAGDRLDLAPGVRHAATVGPDGVVCMEAAK